MNKALAKISSIPSFIWVFLACALGIIIRVIPAWSSIFVNNHVNFSAGPDSYYQINLVKQILDGSLPISLHNIYPSLIYGISWVLTGGDVTISSIEHIAVFIPVLLAVLTIIFTFFIGKLLHSNLAGLIAAFIIAIIPSGFLNRSILGAIDYHAAEVCLTTGAILFFIIAHQSFQLTKRIISCLTGTIFIFLYYLIWPGAIAFLFILILFLIYPIFQKIIKRIYKEKKTKYILISIIAIIFGACLYLTIKLVSSISVFIIAGTSEAAPAIFYPNVFLHIILAILICYFYIRKNSSMFEPIAFWTIYVSLATLLQVRYDYYLIIPLAYLIGFALSSLYGDITSWVRESPDRLLKSSLEGSK